jgi:hypothetical protein
MKDKRLNEIFMGKIMWIMIFRGIIISVMLFIFGLDDPTKFEWWAGMVALHSFAISCDLLK